MMNDTAFSFSYDLYINEFKQVGKLLIYSYCQMILNNEILTSDHENYLRNVLVKKYLRDKEAKKKYNIGYLGFEIEPGEIDIDNITIGFIDIKVTNLGNKDLLDEDEYYSIECKRLDGGTTKNNLYIKEGINRYVQSKYSSQMPFASMIGFIESGNAPKSISDINHFLNQNKLFKTHSELSEYLIETDFNETYISKHERKYSQYDKIDIIHFMLDFQRLMKNETP